MQSDPFIRVLICRHSALPSPHAQLAHVARLYIDLIMQIFYQWGYLMLAQHQDPSPNLLDQASPQLITRCRLIIIPWF
jgi:hypothetical protein